MLRVTVENLKSQEQANNIHQRRNYMDSNKTFRNPQYYSFLPLPSELPSLRAVVLLIEEDSELVEMMWNEKSTSPTSSFTSLTTCPISSAINVLAISSTANAA